MPAKTSPASKKIKAKTISKKPAQKTDADKIRALEEQLTGESRVLDQKGIFLVVNATSPAKADEDNY